MTTNPSLCPCGSQLDYQACCGHYHRQHNAPSAVALMRSRYSAYAMRDIDYLLASWSPPTRPTRLELEQGSPLDWQKLQILSSSEGTANDTAGTVTFIASYLHDGKLCQFCETSRFERVDEQWFYRDGVIKELTKNGPCPCGSGKKYKRCCLA